MSTPPQEPPQDPNTNGQPLAQINPVRVALRLPQRQPIVTYGLIAITVLVFLIQWATTSPGLVVGNVACGDLPACYGFKLNEAILAGQWWRLFTPILLHASLLHIGFNMYALYVLGPELERTFDHLPFFLMYLLGGFAGNVLSFLLSDSPSLGASTAIFGLIGAQAVFVYRNRRLFGRRAQAMLTNILTLAVINLIIGLSPGIDNWGHLGGLIGGTLFAWIAVPVFGIENDGVEFHLVNRTHRNSVWVAAATVAFMFTAFAATKFLF